jgi:putative hemolysin
VSTEDAATGWALYHQLAQFLVEPSLRTIPTLAHRLPPPVSDSAVPEAKVPKLLKTYLAVGSRICSEPGRDHAFGTIDFLTLQDMEQLSPAARSRFLCSSENGTLSQCIPLRPEDLVVRCVAC